MPPIEIRYLNNLYIIEIHNIMSKFILHTDDLYDNEFENKPKACNLNLNRCIVFDTIVISNYIENTKIYVEGH